MYRSTHIPKVYSQFLKCWNICRSTYFGCCITGIAHSLHFTKCFIINRFLYSLFQCCAESLPIFGIIFENIVQSKYLIRNKIERKRKKHARTKTTEKVGGATRASFSKVISIENYRYWN